MEMKVGADGLTELAEGPDEIHPPMHRLKIPFESGKKWKTYTGGWMQFNGMMTAYGPEQVIVPAGTFEAIRVETEYPQRSGKSITAKYWYAPQTGVVKYVYGDHTRVLKSFTAGKK